VTVVTGARVDGVVGASHWPVSTGYAGRPDLRGVLHGIVPESAVPRGSWMTTLDERSSVRGADDLYFRRYSGQTTVAPSL